MVPDRRVSTIGANHEIEVDFNLAGRLTISFGRTAVADFKPSLLSLEIGPGELVVEEKGDVRQGLEDIEEPFVEAATIDSQDCSPVNVIILCLLVQLAVRTFTVDHPAPHRNSGTQDMIDEFCLTGIAHCIETALRQS